MSKLMPPPSGPLLLTSPCSGLRSVCFGSKSGGGSVANPAVLPVLSEMESDPRVKSPGESEGTGNGGVGVSVGGNGFAVSAGASEGGGDGVSMVSMDGNGSAASIGASEGGEDGVPIEGTGVAVPIGAFADTGDGVNVVSMDGNRLAVSISASEIGGDDVSVVGTGLAVSTETSEGGGDGGLGVCTGGAGLALSTETSESGGGGEGSGAGSPVFVGGDSCRLRKSNGPVFKGTVSIQVDTMQVSHQQLDLWLCITDYLGRLKPRNTHSKAQHGQHSNP